MKSIKVSSDYQFWVFYLADLQTFGELTKIQKLTRPSELKHSI